MTSDVPLQSLVLFACAVRHLNFTQVAEEFGTTQPAVSQRIAALEKHLGTSLFRRAHRGVALTPEGAALYDAVREHLAAIESAVERVRRRQLREVLTVATDFAFANFWLMPRLAAFQEMKPELDVRIVTSQNQFDIRGEPVDLAIAFGSGRWPGCDAQRILPEVVVPVCSAALLARHAPATARDVMAMPLLHLDSSGPVRWLTWQDWGASHGVDAALQGQDPGEMPSLRLGNYPLVIQAAIAGRGVALGWRPLVDGLLRDGQLVSPPVPELATPRGYYLVHPHGRAPGRSLDSLREWIVGACAQDAGAAP